MSRFEHHPDRSGNCLGRVLLAIIVVVLVAVALWWTSRALTQALYTMFPKITVTPASTVVAQGFASVQSTPQPRQADPTAVAPREQPQVRGEPLANENPQVVGLGEGGEIIQNWYDPTKNQIITNTWEKSVFLLVSSDPGTLTLHKAGKEPVTVDGRKGNGFGALVFLEPGEEVEIAGVGMSQPLRGDDAHHQTWVEAKSSSAPAEDVVPYLQPWCIDQGKAFCFLLDQSGEVKVLDFRP